jgi:tRNA-modifying protein YgfZ
MPVAAIAGRALITLTGDDASHFLQNLVTCDVEVLATGTVQPGALLTPQGKILYAFLISRDGPGGFRLECDASSIEAFAQRLKLYKMRSKVEFSVQDQADVLVSWNADSPASRDESTAWNRDLRFSSTDVWRKYGPASADADPAAFDALRIVHGVAEAGTDFLEGDAFPHDAGLDQNGGVAFSKGCYVGQEVVSRMQHRGTARRRIVQVTGSTPLPETGTDIMAGGKPSGRLGSVAGAKAWHWCDWTVWPLLWHQGKA